MKAVLEGGPLDGLVVDVPSPRAFLTVALPAAVEERPAVPGTLTMIDSGADPAITEETYDVIGVPCPAVQAGDEPHFHPAMSRAGEIRYTWRRL